MERAPVSKALNAGLYLIVALCLLQPDMVLAAQGEDPESGGCTPAERMCGATYLTHPYADQLWRKLGPASIPTSWNKIGVDDDHSAQSYQVTWRLGASDTAPKGFQIVHTLGGTFYYRDNAPLPADPSTFGYTAQDFDIADKIPTAFPVIAALFPNGATVKACTRGQFSYYLVTSPKSSIAFLMATPASMAHIMPMPELNANVAILPASALKSGLTGIMDKLNYYTNGGNYEVAEFSAAYYYLSHLTGDTATMALKSLGSTAPANVCPDFPQIGAAGIEYPDSWKDAVKSFKD